MRADAPIRAAILDVDGTLVDSNDAHAAAFVDAFREEGLDVPFARVRRLIGMGSDGLLREAAGAEKDSPLGRRVADRKSALFKANALPTLRAFPGVPALLERMRDDGLGLAVATSAHRDELEQLLRIAGVPWLLESSTSASDVEASKPAPDLIQAALERLGCRPAEALMLGDTPYDVEAARRADVGTVALRCGGWDEAGLAGAVALFSDPADLLARYRESPFAR